MRRLFALSIIGLVAAATSVAGAPTAHAEACEPPPPAPPFGSVYFDETGLHVNHGEAPNDVFAQTNWALAWTQYYVNCELLPVPPLEAVTCLRSKGIVHVETKPLGTINVTNRYVHVGLETIDVNYPLLMQDLADCTPLD